MFLGSSRDCVLFIVTLNLKAFDHAVGHRSAVYLVSARGAVNRTLLMVPLAQKSAEYSTVTTWFASCIVISYECIGRGNIGPLVPLGIG